MFCKNCGTELNEDVKVCPSCGTEVNGSIIEEVERTFDNAEKELENVIGSVAGKGGEKLNESRSLLLYILLSIVTCGIYGLYFIYKLAHDVNIACDGDGEKTSGLVSFIFLSLVTCGIYSWIWYYKLGNRLAKNAVRYGLSFQENGTTILLWMLFGSMLCGIGPFIALHIIIKNTNQVCIAYNRSV